tara:strand:+ start:544 stop:714 length:171 start_codon:yes stop_codon:yes gene_type:complete
MSEEYTYTPYHSDRIYQRLLLDKANFYCLLEDYSLLDIVFIGYDKNGNAKFKKEKR